MNFIELFFIAAGLSADAFAVSVCKGLSVEKVNPFRIIAVGLYFGVFQAVMPLLGYSLGSRFSVLIENFDHWLAFGLLALIGGNMIYETTRKDDEKLDPSFGIKAMLPLAVATSIDALAVGVTFACLNTDNMICPAIFIGAVTFVTSAAGLKIGNVFGIKYKSKAEIAGGIILILIGIKILLEHTGVL
ncbi:MAG: manganese efflux pump [Oscillospiraceae bacterium]|nr:manganese efflux pump [Oscillospiraceae bacterium]